VFLGAHYRGLRGGTPLTAALAEFLREKQNKEQGLGLHRRYVLEQVDGELVFRQTEVDAIVADLLDELLFGIKPPESRRIIKQP
jgi:hypothetical protein